MIAALTIGGAPTASGAATTAATPTGSPSPTAEAAPFTSVPAPQEWKPTGGTLQFGDTARIVIDRDEPGQAELAGIATALSRELPSVGMTHPSVVTASPSQYRDGDIVLKLARASSPSATSTQSAQSQARRPEGYRIRTDAHRTEITGDSAVGVFRATRVLLQNVQAQKAMPQGVAESHPAWSERALHLDVARKFYPVDWIEKRMREAAYVGMNAVELHLIDNEDFGIESDTVPQAVSREHLTKADVRHLAAVARELHMTLIPDFDMPGHMAAVIRVHPELQLRTATGAAVPGALDFSKPQAVELLKRIIDEYAPMFTGPRNSFGPFMIGADEFADLRAAGKYPSLEKMAAAKYGAGASAADALTAFANDMNGYVREKGFRTRVFNDGFNRAKAQKIDPSIQVAYWSHRPPGAADVETFTSNGNEVVNLADPFMYYVLGEHNDYPYPTGQRIISERWDASVFPVSAFRVKRLDPSPPQVVGGMFAVWADVPGAQTAEQVAQGIRMPLRATAARLANPNTTADWTEFQRESDAIGDAPGVTTELAAAVKNEVLPNPKPAAHSHDKDARELSPALWLLLLAPLSLIGALVVEAARGRRGNRGDARPETSGRSENGEQRPVAHRR